MKCSTLRIAALLSALVLMTFPAAGIASAAPGPAGHDLLAARVATARFHSLSLAGHAGYGQPPAGVPLHECIASFDDTGAMGFHYINGGLLDANVDASHPEVLVYAPDQRGKKKLVALEYVVFQADWIKEHGDTMPMLFDQPFMATPSPNRYEIPAFFSLHVWLYQTNPAGMFAPFNGNISCGTATASAGATATTSLAAARLGGSITAAGSPRWSCQIAAAPRSA
jgi:hypothetical protein